MKEKGFFGDCKKVLKKILPNRRTVAGVASALAMTISLGAGLAACGNPNDSSSSAEPAIGLGVFYYDNGANEYQIFFADDNVVTFLLEDKNGVGTYTVEGNTVKINLGAEEGEISATLENDVLTLNYGEAEMRFFKKIEYKVSFEEAGGSEVADVTVMNGKTMEKPADPQREGYQFLGWYADSEFTTPYLFGTQLVTSDTTLYAQWAMVEPGKAEFVVDFDLGYEADSPAAMDTIGGKLYNVPTVEREGYKFCGWWISMYENGEKLTYKYNADTVFTANTTLFAVWESSELGSKLSAPEVEVVDKTIRWGGVQGVSIYRLKVTGPDGFLTIDEDVSATSYVIDFDAAPAGDYEIELTAVAANSANNSETVKRSYINKAVGRVSQFSVIDGSVLVFNRIPNADTYYITVDCANDAHVHTMYNNGDSTNYNFSNCELDEDGIKFTVTAAADGYASVTSETFVYNRVLAKVEGVSVDEDTQTLNWYPVENATNYIVSILCGDSNHTHQYVNVGSRTSFSLKECPAAADGTIKINVYAQTKGYNSPEATEYSYEKTKLASPSNIVFSCVEDRYIITWNPVTDPAGGTVKYSLKIGNVIVDTTETSYDITDALAWIPEMKYEITVKAEVETNGQVTNESVWADPVEVFYKMLTDKLSYKAGVVSWEPVIGAIGYEIRVNDGPITTIDNGDSFVEIELTKEGTNTVYVRYLDNKAPGPWTIYEINNAKEIIFDSRGGSAVPEQYKVKGDPIELPVPTREGYDFVGWYNTPKGPESNGAKYESDTFTGDAEMVLYAYWKPATFKLDYVVGNGGVLEAESGSAVYTQNYKLDVPTVEDGTKVFLGWFASSDAESEQLTDDRGYSLKPWNLKQGATVYAQYISNVLKYTLLEDGTYSVSRGTNASKLTSITIPETYNNIPVTVVDGYAFQNCTRLVRVNIPDTIKIISEETAFSGCRRLEEVNIIETGNSKIPVYSSVDGVLLHKNEITGAMELSFYPKAKVGDYVIPEGVTEIPLRLFEGTQVKEVTVAASVTVIRSSAFINCTTLERVIFAEGGTDNLVIEDEAFKNCTGLSSITLPARLSELKVNEETHTMSIFSGCTALTHINVERGNQIYASNDGVITNKAGTELIFCPTARKGSYTVPQGVEKVGDYAFNGCMLLTEIVIPGYVETIGDYAFAGCNRVARVVFSGGAVEGMRTEIGEYAFAGMTTLRTIVFEEGSVVASIGAYAFTGAEALRSLDIPTTMEYIGDYAFEKAIALSKVEFQNGAEGELEFGNYVFSECIGLTQVILPQSVVKLNLGVFDGCVNIAEIKVHADNEYYKDEDGVVYSKDGKELVFFPKGRKTDNGEYVISQGVETISEGAFKGMRFITTIKINNTITNIGNNAFAGSISLTTLTFEEGNDEAKLVIGDEAFSGCAAISAVALPARTQKIGVKAFYSVNMSSVEFPAGLEEIGSYAFARTAITSVVIPADISHLGDGVFDECMKLTEVSFATGYTGTVIPMATFRGTAIEEITIPASVEIIGFAAFNECAKLQTVTFEEGTAPLTIGAFTKEELTEEEQQLNGVFMNATSLKSVNIPDRAILIGAFAFGGCSSLATVSIKETSNLQRIGEGAFYGDSSLSSFYVPKTVQNTPYVDENTSQEYAIGVNAFANSGLVNIEFAKGGEGELSIARGAFANCGGIIGYTEGKFGPEPIYDYMKVINLPNRIAPIYVIENGTYPMTYEGVSRETFMNNGATALDAINIEEGGKYYGSKDGVLYRMAERDGAYVLDRLMLIPSGITSVEIPYTVSVIGIDEESRSENVVQQNASYAYSLKTMTFEATPDGVDATPLTIGRSAFSGCTTLQTVTFPSRLVKIGDSAFYNCSGMTSVTLPASLEYLGESAFRGLTKMTSLTFEKGIKIKEIRNYTFYGCNNSKFTTVEIPASVELIGDNAFYSCSYIANLSFEEGSQLKTIKGGAFNGARVTSLSLPENFTTIDGNMFGTSNTYLKTLTLPSTFTSFTTTVNGQDRFFFNAFSNLTAVNVHADNPYFMSEDGVVYSKDQKTGGRGSELIYYPRGKAINYTEADGTVTAGKFVTPAGLQNIGSYAFYQNTKLKKLVISKDLMYINYRSFYGCTQLTSLTFEERESPLTLGDYAFASCSRLNGVTKDGVNTFEIPESVIFSGTSIFMSAFNNSYSKNVHIVFLGDNESTSLTSTFYSSTGIVSVENIPSNLSSMTTTFRGCTNLKSVTFNDDENSMITTMGGAFYQCTSLESINLPNIGALTSSLAVSSTWSPTSTYVGTFEKCTKLKYVTIKDCTVIGPSVFKDCTNLVGVVQVDENGDPTGKTYFDMPNNVASIGEGAFYNCTSLKDVKLAANLDTISDYAFYGCTNLETVAFPTFVTRVGDRAFENCGKLKNLDLGSGLISIGNYTFSGASSLENVEFPDTLESIGAYAFYNASSLKAIELPASVRSVSTYAFANCSSADKITIEEGLETLEDYAFANCSSVTAFNIPSTLVNLGIGVFSGWDSLKDLTVDGGNLDYAFKDGVLYNATYTKIIYVTGVEGEFKIPETVLSLAEGLFANTKITSVVIPDTITEIPARAFQGCELLTSVTLPAALERIGDYAFEGCRSLKTITIPKTVHSAFEKQYVDIWGDGGEVGYYVSKVYDGIGAYAFGNCTSLENVIFEEGGALRLSFGAFAFYNCTNLKGTLNETTGEYEFVIPNRVRGEGMNSYLYKDPNNPGGGMDSHTRITQGVGMYAFARCTSLQNVIFDNTESVVMPERLFLDIGAFYECTSLKSVTFNSVLGNNNIKIAGGKGGMMTYTITALAERVFYGCKELTTVTFMGDLTNTYVTASTFEGTNVRLPAELTIVDGAFGEDYGDGRPYWSATWSGDNYTIDGCAYCAKNGRKCTFYDPHNGVMNMSSF